MITCVDCKATWTGLRYEHCPVEGCHQTFSGAESGDRHRVGEHGVDVGENRRRCLTVDEMLGLADRPNVKRYFWRGPNGVWHFGRRRPEA